MACKHEKLRCTDNVLVCAVCGEILPLTALGGQTPAQQDDAKEGQIKAPKRKAKKEA